MKKVPKILVAILGGVNYVFNLFIPLAVALLSISFFKLTGYQAFTIMLLAILSTTYRVIDVAFLRR